MIDLCLTNDPNKRPTASDILSRYPFTEPGGTPTSVTEKEKEKQLKKSMKAK